MMRGRLVLAMLAALPLAAACANGGEDADGTMDGGEASAPIEDAGIAPEEAAGLVRRVAALYADPFAVDPLDPPLPMTEELAALFAAERQAAAANEGLAPVLDYAWHVDGQDAEISELEIMHEPVAPGLVAMVARFRNFGEPRAVRYVWARRGEDWLLADIVIGESEDAMAVTLSETLRTR
ncbi:hypothetical protein HFP57_12840 [Parasphingopyxis algicola]|uniref:hypothetical protein n=1 Tax=Parasphingopyxis algicola TaxID=2026624 RepID=UPI0015A03B99|nr:hypothetical protein [Parasphingopyxis algicola]QLC25819.1 hypothetical protein HFP57_12840 [Parasphingopyxis algicola]